MPVTLSSLAGAAAQFFDNNGVPLAGGLIYTYTAGTTTPATTYTSNAGLTFHTNPIVLDAAGRIPTGEVWLTSGVDYKFIVKTSAGVQLGSYDNIPSINDFATNLANTTNPALGDALVGFRQSNSAGNLSGAVGRTVHDKLQDIISIKDFGAVGNGVTNDAAAVQTAIDSFPNNTNVTLFVPNGTYFLNSAISLNTKKVLFILENNATFTGVAPLACGQMKILVPQIGSQAYINANAPDGNNFASSAKSNVCIVRGTSADPDDTVTYVRNALFVETHSDSNDLTQYSQWGNPYKKTSITGEFVAEAGFAGEANAAAFRTFAPSPATSTVSGASILVGVSAVASSNTGAGTNAYDVWGANFVAARPTGQLWNGGEIGKNIVGIEVDINPSTTAVPYLLSGFPGATNYTGYWAQAAVSDTIECNVAFFATSTSAVKGWQTILGFRGACSWWMSQLITTTNDVLAQGMYVRTRYAGAGGSLLLLETGTIAAQLQHFNVTTEVDNPIYVRVSNALKQVTQGAVDSGGAGYRLLRVEN